MSVVTGQVEWASVQAPNTKFTPAWEITVILSKDEAKRLSKEGLPIKKGEDGNFRIKFKRNVDRKNGSKNSPPRVIDVNNNPFVELIGNGSTCAVQYLLGEWQFAGKKGIKGTLIGVKVLDHVAYARDELADIGENSSSSNSADDFDFNDDDDPFDD